MSAALTRSTASASKAKSKPIPRPTEDSDSEESLPLVPASSSSSRYRSLTVARWPRIHSIKEPFQLTLGGKMQAPKRSRGRRTEFSFVETLPMTLKGQWKFVRDTNALRQDVWTSMSSGVWRRVYASSLYSRIAFKISQSSTDQSYNIEELRAFRALPDVCTRFIQEFTVHLHLGSAYPDETTGRTTWNRYKCHVVAVEKVTSLDGFDTDKLDTEELILKMVKAVAQASQSGFRVRDIGYKNWGLALRSGRMAPVVLDANSWTRLVEGEENYGRWPSKRDVHSLWGFWKTLNEPLHDRMNDLVYGRNWLDSNGILEEVNRLLAGCDGPERWNPYRDADNVVS